VGWQEQRRDLPYQSRGAQRSLTRLFAGSGTAASRKGWSGLGRIAWVRARAPQGSSQGAYIEGTSQVPLWHSRRLALRINPRLEGELARVTGNHVLTGATVEAAWVPSERWRYMAGLTADLLAGGGSTSLVRPVGGVTWTTPVGPTLSASIRSALHGAWFAEQAAVPYAFLTGPIQPERGLVEAELSVWQQTWDGSEGRLTYQFRESRNALSWRERPGEGLWQPQVLSELRIHEVQMGLSYLGMAPLRIYGEGRWRSIRSPNGQVANLPRGEGTAGVEWTWRSLTAGLELEVVRARPRAVQGPALSPFEDLRLKVSYKPVRWAEVYGRGENLLGQDIERWGGYPEPKRLLTLGTIIAF